MREILTAKQLHMINYYRTHSPLVLYTCLSAVIHCSTRRTAVIMQILVAVRTPPSSLLLIYHRNCMTYSRHTAFIEIIANNILLRVTVV